MRRIPWLGLAMAAALAAPAAAQAPEPYDPDAALVEELVVTGREPGPAWWRVSDADTTVYVLGSPSLAPKRMQWDRAVFERRLSGANEVILPFQNVRVKFKGVVGATFNFMRLRSGAPFEETLSPAARARFAAVRERLGQPADHYKTRNPLAAGLILASDYRDHENLTTSDPTKLIKLLAERSRIPVRQKTYDLGPLMGQILKTSDAAGRACLDEVLEQAEAGPAGTLAAARAWAEGDVRGALAAERSYERCLAMVPGARAFDDRVKADQAAAIVQALKKPGHAVAVVQLRPLLSQGGVLDRLRAQGFTVKAPGEV
ncbi:MAG: TraB/GumN family protein [Phenylobacterium sp.]|uniref:TraB/GumN family protein n=1 Tax=Phenylobacterium sp. TaxID=1871053 RepID=UPI00391DCC73